jgi:hypothetical protein
LKYTDPSGLEVWNPFTDDWDELDKGQTLINMMPFVGPAAGKIANFLGGSDYDTRSQLAQSATSVFKSETAGDIAELAAGFAASGGSLIRFLVQRGARAGTAVAAEGLIGSAENLAASAENASASSIKSAQTLVTAPSPPMAPVAPAAGVVHRPNTLVAVAETQLHSASAIFGEAASQAQTARWWAYVQRRLAETASERAAAMDLYNRGYRVKGAGAILKMIGDEANAIFGGVGF